MPITIDGIPFPGLETLTNNMPAILKTTEALERGDEDVVLDLIIFMGAGNLIRFLNPDDEVLMRAVRRIGVLDVPTINHYARRFNYQGKLLVEPAGQN